MFGLNASPFLINATLRHHISKFMAVDPEFVKKLIDSFYVDDFVGGAEPRRVKLSICIAKLSTG